jgi:hypothetical protein
MRWIRVHKLPEYAYFAHNAHVRAGIGCVTCHGQVNEMPLTWREHTLHMKWCLDCHRNPQQHLRPREQVFSMAWKVEHEKTTQADLGRELVEKYRIEIQMDEEGHVLNDSHANTLTNCSTCHR